MLDEFYALGHLEIISTVWSLVRGYGVQIMPILQNIVQLKERYPENWETFLGMAGVVASFAPNDLTTAEWLSRRGGETTRTVSSLTTGSNNHESMGPGGISSGGGASFGTSSNPSRTTLITPHRFFGLRTGYMVGAFDGLSDLVPIYAPPYYDIRQCRDRGRDNPYFLG